MRRAVDKSDQHRITVLLDCTSVTLFANRMFKFLDCSKSGIVVDQLTPPANIFLLFRLLWKLIKSRHEIVHYLYGSKHPIFYILPKMLGKKVIVHWVGSDVSYVNSRKDNIIKRLLRPIANRMADMHLADFDPLAYELKSMGIKAQVVPLIPDLPIFKEELFWPVENRIFVYLPEINQDNYLVEVIFRLAQELRSIDFLITSNSGKELPKLPNVKYLGRVDNMDTVWKQVKIYLRLIKHDGLSHTVLEALARGKYVVWTYKLPHCYQGRTFKEAKEAIMEILSQNQPNIKGMEYVNLNFTPSKIIEDLKQKYLEVLS